MGIAVAPDVAVLVAARVIQATGAALVIPASLGLLLHAFPQSERAGATGAWAAVGAIAAASGPPLGGVLVLASCPGTVAVLTWRVRSLVSRWGASPVTIAGCLAYAAGRAWWAWRLGTGRHFALDFLPGSLLCGIGVPSPRRRSTG